jgi:hypothetical protein
MLRGAGDRSELLRELRLASADPEVMAAIRRRADALSILGHSDRRTLERIASHIFETGIEDIGLFLREEWEQAADSPANGGGGGGPSPPPPTPPEPPPPPPPGPKPKVVKARLVVVVKDEDGKPIPDADVTASGQAAKKTNASGIADFGEVDPGTYSATATKANHGPKKNDVVGKDEKTGVAVPAGKTTQVDLIQHEQWRVEFVTPGVDPVNAPNSTTGSNDQNEYTYSIATPGLLKVTLRARVIPAGRVNEAKPHVKFEVDAIADSPLTWDGAGDGTATTVNGDMLETAATYTGLPKANAAFGTKNARLFRLAAQVATRPFEAFFPRDAKNHPNPGQGTTPNWFFYWGPLSGVANLTYAGASGSSLLAEVRGMTKWTYATAPDKVKLYIFDETLTASPYRPYGVGVQVSGIDGFIATAIHENMHIQQIARADPLVPGVTCWRHGYSWNQGAQHNHYGPGPDGLWGPAPGVAAAAVSATPPFVAGQGDDVTIDASDHWPTAFGAVPAVFASALHPIEREAVHKSDATVTADHTFARQDWADPGKNHGTLNKWND